MTSRQVGFRAAGSCYSRGMLGTRNSRARNSRLGLGVAISILLATLVSGFAAGEDTNEREAVVLLHGLGRTSRSMRPLARALSEAGFEVHNLDYASRRHDMAELAEQLHGKLMACRLPAPGRLHFVTHSMGGILLRAYLQNHELPQLGRVVMLSPPNRGSELIDELGDQPIFREAIGPAGRQLGTDPESQPSRLGPVNFELGVITGDRSANPWFSWLIPGDDDGKVSVERARIAGMKDFLVVPYTHTFIMQKELVQRQTLAFLRTGHFEHADEGQSEGATYRRTARFASLSPTPVLSIELSHASSRPVVGALGGLFLGLPSMFLRPFAGAVTGVPTARPGPQAAGLAGVGATPGPALVMAAAPTLPFAALGVATAGPLVRGAT